MNPNIYGYNPMMMQAQQQRLAEYEAQYPQFAQMPQYQPQQNFVKCRAVTSIDEAKASMIDLDGSVHVFTDIGNKKIYTKQINLDGTAKLSTYVLQDDSEPAPETQKEIFVKPEELEAICKTFSKQIRELDDKLFECEEELARLREEKKARSVKK